MATYVVVHYGTVINVINSDVVPVSPDADGNEYFVWPGSPTWVGSAFNMGSMSTAAKTAAQNQLDERNALGILHRAVASVLVDEINALRDWLTAFKVAMAAATSLANLQTRVAALANTPDRTLAQARTAIKAAITGGTVDS